MLATKKPPVPKLELISGEPGLSEFEFFLQKAQSSPGKLVTFAWWTKARNQRFVVKLLYKDDRQTLWQVVKEHSDSTAIIWEHSCNDVLLVYNLIAATCGLQQKDHVIDGVLTVSGAQKDIARSSFVTGSFGADPSNMQPESPAPVPILTNFQAKDSFQKRAAESRNRAMGLLTDWTSGLYNYGAFIVLLNQEFLRAFRAKTSLTVVVIKLAYSSSNQLSRLPAGAEAEAIKHLNKVKRQIDILGHFDDDRLAVILPQAKKEGAKRFVARLIKALNAANLGCGVDSSNLHLSIGIATAPTDSLTVDCLLESAHEAQLESQIFPINQESVLLDNDMRIA